MTLKTSRSLLFAAFFASALALALCCAACGADGRFVLIGTARAPSASGIVEVDDLGDGNAQVAVHLEFLHPPSRLDPSLTTFVTWFVPPTGAAVRAGALRYDPAQRTGDLTQTAPFHRFTLLVTAERDPNPTKPSAFVIATQGVVVD
jgi:hypothetical protein